METDVHTLETCEELELINVLLIQTGINNTSKNFYLVVKRIMSDDLDFIRAIGNNPQAALVSYNLASAEIEFFHGFVLSKIDFEKQIR